MSNPGRSRPPAEFPTGPVPARGALLTRERLECDEQFNELMVHLLQVFWVRDAASNAVIYVSPAYETIWGRTCQSLYDNNQTLLDSIHPEDRERTTAAIKNKRETEGYEEKFRIVRPSGEVRWVWARSYPVRNKQGEITRFAGLVEDITDQRANGKGQRRLGAIVEFSGDVVVSVSAHGIVIAWSPGAARVYGYPAEEILGHSFSLLFPPGRYQGYQQIMSKVGTGESLAAHETERRRKDGTLITLTLGIVPVNARAPEGFGASKAAHDLGTIKRLEAQFIEAQKMEAIGQLAGGVAHDFNNVIAVIMGYSELILEALGPDHALRKEAEEIRNAAARAAGLTRQLLSFSRKQTVQPVVLDLGAVVKELDKMLRQLLDENITLSVVRGPEVGRVKADPGSIGQVLLNLVVNARDAMPNGGKLSITTDNATLDADYAGTHPGVTPGEYVLLSVNDTGTGITDQVKGHLFEAFFTTKPRGKGTGLGLTSCQTIVNQSGGHIEVSSEVSRGTTFTVYLPRVDQPLEPTPRPARTGSALSRGSETLLVVEDEPAVRHLAVAVLQGQGYEVLSAANGQHGLRVAREHQGTPIRLVITDVIMPQMGGKVMAEWLKTTYPDLKVLFTSGYTDEAIEHHGVLDPGVAFLPKPYTPATLARQVRDLLDAPSQVECALE